jgi:hypothetical protein
MDDLEQGIRDLWRRPGDVTTADIAHLLMRLLGRIQELEKKLEDDE